MWEYLIACVFCVFWNRDEGKQLCNRALQMCINMFGQTSGPEHEPGVQSYSSISFTPDLSINCNAECGWGIMVKANQKMGQTSNAASCT